MKQKETNVWRIIAIIFITIAILEGIYIGWAWNYGGKIIEKENECGVNICVEYDAYYFDAYDNVCYCYKNGEIEYMEFIK